MTSRKANDDFDVEKYLQQVMSSADAPLADGINDLKADLNKIAHTKGLGEINQAKLDQACDKLREKTKAIFRKNFTKFSLYAARNVFQQPSTSSTSAASSSSSKQPDNEIVEIEAQLEEAKQRYLQAQTDYVKVTTESRDMDKLIKEMRNALFTLRVASQSFEELDSQSLDDAAVTIRMTKNKLEQYCEEATGLLARLDEPASAGHSVASRETAASIQSGDVDSIRKVTQSLHGKK